MIITAVFKPLVSRLTSMSRELRLQENLALYCEIRQLIAYVRDSHGGTFRRVALSGLVDSAHALHKEPKREEKKKVKKGLKNAHSSHSIHDEPTLSEWPLPGTGLITQERLKVQRSPSPRLSITEDEVMVLKKKGSRGFNLSNWFRPTKAESLHPEAAVLLDNGQTLAFLSSSEPSTEKLVRRASFSRQTIEKTSGHHSTFGKARKRVEDQFRFVFGKSKSKHGSFEDTPDLSRRNSFDFERSSGADGDLLLVRESRLVSLPAVRDGMIRFQFLLDSCTPGTLPDPPLIAAMLDIRAPVVARAAFFLECAHFVHRCNRGLWPQWMRHNFNIFRPSGPARQGSQSVIRGRASNVLQRSAGRAFFQWAEMVGARLEELLLNQINDEKSAAEDPKRRQVKAEDEEDFLDEAAVNPSGSACPLALKLVACQLLYEVTAFLRETHQYLPSRSARSSIRERGSTFEPRTVTANRRWSMALSESL